jgi:hypothetical protein
MKIKSLRQNIWSLCRYLKPGLPEYEVGALISLPRRSIRCMLLKSFVRLRRHNGLKVDYTLLGVMGRDFVSALQPVAYCTIPG